MTTLAHVPLPQIHTHPSNPRFEAAADDDMVASVQAQGILTPVTLAPALDGDGYVLIGGHRRRDAATKAGLTQLPAIVRDDLVTEAQQVEAMLVENLHRVDLTPVEEAQAYEQLTLFGMDAAAIADATGRSASTVKARLKLNALPQSAKAKVHAGEATLDDAAALLEFADDPDVLAHLEAAFGTGNFRWRAQSARDDVARVKRQEKELQDLMDAGAVVVDLAPAEDRGREGKQCYLYLFPYGSDLYEPAGHPDCLGVIINDGDTYRPFIAVCTNPAGHPLTENETGSQPSWVDSEAYQANLQRQADRTAAAKVRGDWLVANYVSVLPAAAKAKPLVEALRGALPAVLITMSVDGFDVDKFLPLMGVEAAGGWADQCDQLRTVAIDLSVAKPDQVIRTFAAFLATLTDSALTWDPDEEDAPLIAEAWTWIAGAGYPMSDVDQEYATIADTGRARACVVDPALFASIDVLDHTLAASHCDVCPVFVPCREAVDQTAEQRPELLVGTYAGRRFGGAS